MGSSPLTRGKHDARRLEAFGHGLIPAHAGKTLDERPSFGETAAHPRSRGENCWILPDAPGMAGSSPLTRGKRSPGARVGITPRLIPAHAGKTIAARSKGSGRGAHPRSRGENTAAGLPASGAGGSSPLTRGKRDGPISIGPPVRLIPAHAGKTRLRASWAWRTLAHPRSRGENCGFCGVRASGHGSSPLTRGKQLP